MFRTELLMIVRMWMTPDPRTISPDARLTEAATVMSCDRIRRLPVVTEEGARLVGMLAAHDLLRAFPPSVNPFGWSSHAAEVKGDYGVVSDLMTHPALTIAADAPLEAAAVLLRDRQVGALAVVQRGALVGIITESDIFRAFIGILGADAGGVRVTCDITDGDDPLPIALAAATRHGMRLASYFTVDESDRRLGVARVIGPDPDGFIEDVWRSGQRVLNVLRQQAPQPAPPHDGHDGTDSR